MYLMVNGSPDASSVVPFHQEIREFVMTPRDLSQQTASAEAVIVASETMAHDQQHVGRRSLVVPAEDFLVGENARPIQKFICGTSSFFLEGKKRFRQEIS